MLNLVWLIDDDQVVNYINDLTIIKLGFSKKVQSFLSCDQALIAFEQVTSGQIECPEVIFLDMHLIGMEPKEFLLELNKLLLKSSLPVNPFKIYLLSSSDEADAINHLLQLDIVTGFLPKPLIDNDLSTL